MRPFNPYDPPWWTHFTPYRVFYFLTGGITLTAFFIGFSDCLFDINNVQKCVEYSQWAVDVLKGVGDKIIAWGVLFVKGAFGWH